MPLLEAEAECAKRLKLMSTNFEPSQISSASSGSLRVALQLSTKQPYFLGNPGPLSMRL